MQIQVPGGEINTDSSMFNFSSFYCLPIYKSDGVQVLLEMRGSECVERQEADQQAVGTAEGARRRVRAYFQSLRDQLCAQEVAALTVVDTHLRERLCSIRQQEEDIATLLSQVPTYLRYRT